jgi:hypothetical protein
MIEPRDPFYEPPSTPRPRNLQLLNSLIPLQGHISAIYASLLFHVLDGDKQVILAKRLAALLSPEPGSVICGWLVGASVPINATMTYLLDYFMVCHRSLEELWDGQIFEKGKVKVDATITEVKRSGQHIGTRPMLEWSITRL